MDINWFIIVLAFVAILAAITFLVKENQKDEKEVMKKRKMEDEMMNLEQPDTEV